MGKRTRKTYWDLEEEPFDEFEPEQNEDDLEKQEDSDAIDPIGAAFLRGYEEE